MKAQWVFLPLLCVLTASGCMSGMTGAGNPAARSRLIEVRYAARVENVPGNDGELRLWIPVPRSDRHQKITALTITAPFKHVITTETKYGNKMAFFTVPNPPSSLDVEMRFHVRRFENNERYGRSADIAKREFALEPTRLVPLSSEIRKRALDIVSDRDGSMEKGRALYEYVLDRMTYDKTGSGWGRGDFWYACDARKGNCTDFHAYFIGLCRNIEIPACFEIGLSVPAEPASGKTGDYHCWAYFWNGREWVPVDISEADKNPLKKEYFFGNLCENRVAFTVGRDIVLNPAQKGAPLNFFIHPYAEVDGKLHSDVMKESCYRNLEEGDAR